MKIRHLSALFTALVISPVLPAMEVSGKLTVSAPTTIAIDRIDGRNVVEVKLASSGEFRSDKKDILPDVYVFRIGSSKEFVYLDNSDITITGYLDPSNASKSQLKITGIDANSRFQVMAQKLKDSRGDVSVIAGYAKEGKAAGPMLSALAYTYPAKTYEQYRAVADVIKKPVVQNDSFAWLNRQLDSLSSYRIGGPAYNFDLVAVDGSRKKLSDYRGKYVLLDFWASWCGPCKQELKGMKTFYPKFSGKNVVFISISLDDTRALWQKGMDEEKIPWTNLWDDSGGMKVSPLKKEYGFRSIPFIVIIDPQGNYLARGIRGAAVEKMLESLNL